MATEQFISFNMDGSAVVRAKLKSMADEVQQKIINTALREGAKVYQGAVTEAAPEEIDDPNPGSNALPKGALKSDVIIQKVQKQSSYRVAFGRLTAGIARLVDEGHDLAKGGRLKLSKKAQARGDKQGKKIGTVPAYPFFRNAFESASSEAEKAIEESITKQVASKWKE